MFDELPASASLMADAGFTGDDLLAKVLASGRPVLIGAAGNVTPLEKPGYGVWDDRTTEQRSRAA